MPQWPDDLFEFAYAHNLDQRLDALAAMAEPEEWDYQEVVPTKRLPILYNFLRYSYARIAEENKIELSQDGEFASFNTGLVTPNQEEIFALFEKNKFQDRQAWFLSDWCKKGDKSLVRFQRLPEMAAHISNPADLVFDFGKEFRINIDHIVVDNKGRFPEPFCSMDNFVLQTLLKGLVDNARERVRRNYKTAIPQYYKGRIQLLLPLCISSPTRADLAIVVENHGSFYLASTCLTLDMAYSNARLLAKPDRDWLKP